MIIDNIMEFIIAKLSIVLLSIKYLHECFDNTKYVLSQKQLDALPYNTKQNIKNIEKYSVNIIKKLNIGNTKIYYTYLPLIGSYVKFHYYKKILIIDSSFIFDKMCDRERDEEYKFTIAHELSHLSDTYNNIICFYREFMIPLITIMLCIISDQIWYPILFQLCSLLFYIIIQRKLEKNADIKAIEILGSKKYGIQRMQRLQKINIEHKKNLNTWKRFFIGNNGDAYYDITHPLLSSRINYINNIQL